MFEADVLISIPTLKNHDSTVTTGTVKNLGIGATPPNIYGDGPNDTHRLRMVNHQSRALHQWIADYYTVRPADFTVMDALQGLSHGPSASFDSSGIRDIRDAQKNLRAILASADGLAIDVVQTNIMNWDIDTVLHLQYLIEAGIVGNGNSQNIVVLGAKVDDLRTDFGGINPSTGRRLTAADRNPPEISITSAQINGHFLNLQIAGNADKIDIYLDGEYLTSASGNFSELNIKNRRPLGNSHEITIYAFDRRMHHTTSSTRAVSSRNQVK
jgi:hypothetical protein